MLGLRIFCQVVQGRSGDRKLKRDCDFALYCERNLVEQFFYTIKNFRGIATVMKDCPQLSGRTPRGPHGLMPLAPAAADH